MVVVEEGNTPHRVKREGELSGRGACPGGYLSLGWGYATAPNVAKPTQF